MITFTLQANPQPPMRLVDIEVSVLQGRELHYIMPNPLSADDFKKLVDEWFAKVPADRLHTAKIDFTGSDEDGACVSLWYTRDETDEELAARQVEYRRELQRLEELKKQRETASDAAEIMLLRKLMKKYGLLEEPVPADAPQQPAP